MKVVYKIQFTSAFAGEMTNRPFYSYEFIYLPSECKRGWRWLCFNTELSAFLI